MLCDDLSDFARAIVQSEAPSPHINADYAQYSSAVAIGVYRNNYFGNLHDALAGAYPVIEQLVGRDFFRHLARSFIQQHGSKNANLHHYGAQMADFLATFEPSKYLVYLPDFARLEWACHCAYFAEDATALNLADLAQIPPECYADMILHLHPSCHLLSSRYPISAIWHAHQPDAACDFHIDLDRGGSNVLVIRCDDLVNVVELLQADAAWLQAVQKGASLGVSTDAIQVRYPDFDLPSLLLMLVANNALTNFNLKEIT